ncbi:GNAT family N-acetyltransferase [Arthrobacter sp. ISL-30]|uniref:GNAT family N-acetyltransferase n=1 Tax=Arthrobacter sp. ISL-30 TaxID=2819109 RepID=UPI001BE7D68B|nr:GNAT family N-acetyltransferase [Arthrobacter sp. ISL-30]
MDEEVLDQLVEVATKDARANEVTPPMSPGADWTPVRIAWLRAFHRERRQGVPGPMGEATWAIVSDGLVVGSMRLKATGTAQAAKTGIWLAQGERGRGTGIRAMAEVLEEAASLGFRALRAETTADNHGALGLLNHLGFELEQADDEGRIRATRALPQADATGASPS